MDCERLLGLSDDQCRRSTGVKRATFETMTAIVNQAHTLKTFKGGRPTKLSMAKQLLMSLMDWREYRTYLHGSLRFGVSESRAYKTIRWVEAILIQEGSCSLPGKKARDDSDHPIEVMLVDATETPIARPKKAEKRLCWQEKATYVKKPSCR